MKKRIGLYTKNGGREIRELLRIWQNEFNDVMLDMDGGQTVQFTPQQRPYTMPSAEDVQEVAQSLPRMSIIEMKGGAGIPPIWGDFRIIPTPLIEDPAERTARELTHARQTAAKQAAPAPVHAATTPPDMMSIAEAVEYTGKSEKTIRTWLGKMDGDKPMLPGVIWNGKIPRIPRTSLEPWRRRSTKKPPVNKTVKHKVKGKITR